MANEIRDAGIAARAERKAELAKDAMIEQQRREIEALRTQLDARRSGDDVIILEKHSNDLWKGTGIEYDDEGNVVRIRQRQDTFVLRRSSPAPTKEEVLEAVVAQSLNPTE